MKPSGRTQVVGALLLAAFVAACSSSTESDDKTTSIPPTPVAVQTDSAAPSQMPSTVDSAAGPDNTAAPTGAPIASAATTPDITAGPPETTLQANGPTDRPGSCIAGLTVRERAALLVWPAVYADDWVGAVDTVRSNDVGGVLLMSQRGLDADQVRDRLSELEAASRHGLIVATDEEGGDVQRLSSIGELRSQRQVSRDLLPDAAEDLIAKHGRTVRSVGVDMVLGPVVDVEPNVGEVPLQASRFFEGDPERVSEFASAYLSGWERAGLFATLKHYPGHGAASGDTHITTGVTPSVDDVRAFDLRPYRDLAAQAVAADAAVMIGHLTVPGLTGGMPATRSPAAIDYLRNELGYRNSLLITDALGMAAVGIPEPEASVLALAAGIDVVLFTMTSQTDEVIDALETAVADGRIDRDHLDDAAERVMAMLARDGHTCNGNR